MSPSINPVWIGLAVGCGVGWGTGSIQLGGIAGLSAWAVVTAYLRYKQLF